MVYDLLNGARLVGEYLVGADRFTVANPAVIMVQKAEDSDQVKLSINPVLFTTGAAYTVQPSSVVGVFQCFDPTIHQVYNRALTGEALDVKPNDSSDASAGAQ